MAPARTKRQSRKRRRAGTAPERAGGPPASTGESRPDRVAQARPERVRAKPPSGFDELSAILTGRTYGERPPSYFAPVPVSEIAIGAGVVGAVVGVASGSRTPLIVGIVLCILGVLEFTLREHLSGYRSHAALLAAVPAGAILALSVAVFGAPHQRSTRELMVVAALPVFALLFWLLRKRFLTARQSRVVRPPGS